MPFVVTAADVEVYAELTRRLTRATSVLLSTSAHCARLLDATRWTGGAAAAARAEEQRLAQGLSAVARRLGDLTLRSARRRDELSAELAGRTAFEASVLNDLGALARAPGDVEAGVRAEISRIRGALPPTGHELWTHLHTMTSLFH